MVRSLFGSAALWSSVAMLVLSGSASAQWFPFGGSSCNCGARTTAMSSAPIMQSAAYSAAYNPISYAAESVSCGQPIACTITQPVHVQAMAIAPVVQTVRVQALQPVVHPVYDTVHVTEFQAVKQKVQKPVVETKWVDQAVTEMRPVTQQRTVNVPTVDYQTVTEYKQVQKQVGYWATKTEATGKISACQYDNRPGLVGSMNRMGHDIRNAFVPNTRVSRTFVPQTMTCTVPCSKRVAVAGMKQVTYNVTQMVPQQTTRKVAINTVRYVEEEITAMKPVTVARTMQVGTRVSYAPPGTTGGTTATGPGPSNGGQIGLTPTPDTNSSARRPTNDRTGSSEPLDSDGFNRNRKISYPVEERDTGRGDVTETTVPARPVVKAPSTIRISQWVARTPATPDMSLAGTAR